MSLGWRKSGISARQQQVSRTGERQAIKHAEEEIHAYIAIRDLLLAEAEEAPTNSTLHRATIANDVVEVFLKPVRAPYEAQYLPENEARVERERCDKIKHRIRDLRGKTPPAGAGTIGKSEQPTAFGVRARAH